MSRVAISGCSGAGKSRLVAEMARRGRATCEEPGRRVVRAELTRGGAGVRWREAERFARLCVEICLQDLARPVGGPVLHDRSLVDAVSALARMSRARSNDPALLVRHRHDDNVLLAPPWPEISAADAERRHGMEEAVAEHENLREAYPAPDYTVTEAPRLPVSDRADWLEAMLVRHGEPAQ